MSENAKGPVTGREMHMLRSDGYFIRRGFFDQVEIDELERAADGAAGHRNDAFEGYDDIFRRISTRDGFIFVNELFDDSPYREAIAGFCQHPAIRDIARSIGGPMVAHCCYQLVYKYSGHDRPMAWHQDEISTPASIPFFNMWIALSEMRVENGCLWTLPGVGLDRVYPHVQTSDGLCGWPMDGPNQGIPLEMHRGDVCLMGSKTFHKSGGNTSSEHRKAMLIIFMDSQATINGQAVSTTPYAS